MLTLAISLQRFQVISGRRCQIAKRSSIFKLKELSSDGGGNPGRKMLAFSKPIKILRARIREAFDHTLEA
jgi:hypothetical protein